MFTYVYGWQGGSFKKKKNWLEFSGPWILVRNHAVVEEAEARRQARLPPAPWRRGLLRLRLRQRLLLLDRLVVLEDPFTRPLIFVPRN
jgi:hypothetical protein